MPPFYLSNMAFTGDRHGLFLGYPAVSGDLSSLLQPSSILMRRRSSFYNKNATGNFL